MTQEVPSFDKAKFLAQFEGLKEVAEEAVTVFLETLPSLMSSIAKAAQDKDARALEISAHTLKGVVSNFFAGPAQELALSLEKSGRSAQLDGVDAVVVRLKTEVVRLETDLRKLQKNEWAA